MDGERWYRDEDVIGDETILPVSELDDDWEARYAAIVRIITTDELGTGFFISPRHILTAHHVLPSRAAVTGARVHRADAAGVPRYSVAVRSSGFFHSCENLDYSVFEVVPVYEVKALDLTDAVVPPVGSIVRVIGYPAGGRMKTSGDDASVVSVTTPFLKYRADTLGGMSGAPVLRADTKELVAMHHFGDRELDDSGNEGVLASSIAKDFGL